MDSHITELIAEKHLPFEGVALWWNTAADLVYPKCVYTDMCATGRGHYDQDDPSSHRYRCVSCGHTINLTRRGNYDRLDLEEGKPSDWTSDRSKKFFAAWLDVVPSSIGVVIK